MALNPLEVKLLSVLKRTTIVLPLDSTGLGILPPQNLPFVDRMSVLIGDKHSYRLSHEQHFKIPVLNQVRTNILSNSS